MKYKICVVGDQAELLPYRMAGIDTFAAQDEQSLDRLIDSLAHQQYGVIYLIENWAARVPQTLARYEKEFVPALIPLPGLGDTPGAGSARLKAMVEMAIGINILKTGE